MLLKSWQLTFFILLYITNINLYDIELSLMKQQVTNKFNLLLIKTLGLDQRMDIIKLKF
ncbi:hypothetical protein C7M16_02113 [Bacillus subtilis]|nr:hypothetical protein S101392_02471 [Bacillus subtilis subsp. subtilis]QHJ95069.1 hypothetical protein C7M16_02113 [Bacillus subtilis]CJR80864.1 Uncharacterised protein [Streptococcus pneumoniae]CON27430.1 Uncharacterised protein [Bacillus subtilis]